jgi:hypothetical protein
VTRDYLRDELEELRTVLTDLQPREPSRTDDNHDQAAKKSP